MLQRVSHLLKMNIRGLEVNGLLDAHGVTVPADGATGYATGCLFRKLDGGVGTSLYVNEGDETSADFNAVTTA